MEMEEEIGQSVDDNPVWEPGFTQLWKQHDQKAQKAGPHSMVYFVNGNKYQGNWYDNKPNDRGTLYLKNGNKIEGRFSDGLPDGPGMSWVKSGKGLRLQYRGDFGRGLRHGQGTMCYKNGERYEGGWYAGKRHGQGKMFFSNGDVYDGEWRNDKRDGEGTLHVANGDVFQGLWHNDKKDGQGTFYYVAHRKRYDGVWKEDIAKCGMYGAIDNGDGSQCPVQLPPNELKEPVGVLSQEASALQQERTVRVAEYVE